MMSTQYYEQMIDVLYETQWYSMPVRLQKCLIPVIASMQKPLYYSGFGIAVLNLEMLALVKFHKPFIRTDFSK